MEMTPRTPITGKGDNQPKRPIRNPIRGTATTKLNAQPVLVITIACPLMGKGMVSLWYACMEATKTCIPIKVKLSARIKTMNVGKKVTTAHPRMKSPIPVNMPLRRLRLSKMEVINGTRMAAKLRMVTANEMVVRSTPRPRPNTARNGYTMRIMA